MSLPPPAGSPDNARRKPDRGEPFASRWAALRITLIYTAVGGLWILLSDRLVYFFFDDNASAITRMSIYKGWLYVLLTAVLLHQLIRRAMSALRRSRHVAEAARMDAEAANRAKDRFLAVLSHELRTPLTPVLATVSALQRQGELDSAQREDLEMIRRNVEMEARLIDDLLDLTRIAAGKMHLDVQTTDVHQVIHSALEICAADLQAHQFTTELHLDARQHHVSADATRLTQVFWNLLTNAIKFTPDNGRIALRTANVGGDSALRVEIADSGEGIDPPLLPRIFDAFQQGQEPAAARRAGGLGLGLAICKTIVELHHGSIRARSEGRGQGATFTIELPTVSRPSLQDPAAKTMPAAETLPAAAEPPTCPHPPGSARQTPASLRILLVEDNGDSARMLGRLLRIMGHQVRIAGTVAEALDAAADERFDLLVSDIALPDGTGLDVMRGLQRIRSTPGIALSGFGMDEDIHRSLDAGFIEHLTKPVTAERLEAVIARVRCASAAGV